MSFPPDCWSARSSCGVSASVAPAPTVIPKKSRRLTMRLRLRFTHCGAGVPDGATKVRQRPVHVPSMERVALSSNGGHAANARLPRREAIPGLPHGVKVTRLRRVDFELPPKLHDVHVDGARHD